MADILAQIGSLDSGGATGWPCGTLCSKCGQVHAGETVDVEAKLTSEDH